MVEEEPCGANGELTKKWMQFCLGFEASSELPTSANLLKDVGNLHKQQASRPSTASVLNVGKDL
ncbi:hypothetical protein LTR66_007346, partial [Elasticomyces elasticus]